MSFREKSCWVMVGVMVIAGLFYLRMVTATPGAPVTEIIVPYTLVLVVLSIGAQLVLALRSPAEAAARADERERAVMGRAGRLSGLALAAGVVVSGGLFMVDSSGLMLFHRIVFALIGAQILDYALTIAFLRRPV